MPDGLRRRRGRREAGSAHQRRGSCSPRKDGGSTRRLAEDFARRERLLLIAGHYEGFDERIIEGLKPIELSIGDYVLSGGELAAMVVIDAVVRLLPGALGAEDGAADETFADGLLEYPQYTRPREFRGMRCRTCCSAATTRRSPSGGWSSGRCERKQRRPDLWQAYVKRDEDREDQKQSERSSDA